ncbi:MAG: hypothetical protein KDK70_05935 [Myxococcales bacterium]|nr:hypothetical protein [Myxococcales bacterium]
MRAGLAAILLSGCVLDSTLGAIDTTDGDSDEATASGTRGDASQTGQASLDGGSNDDGSDGAGSDDGGSDGPGSELPPPPPEEWVVPEQCAAVASESAYCLTLDYTTAMLIGVDTGSTCVVATSLDGPLASPSFAWRGMSMVTCGLSESLGLASRIDLQTGQIDALDTECWTITDMGDRILVDESAFDDVVAIYDDFAAIATDTPRQQLELELDGTRMWTDGEQVLSAWHSTDTVWRSTLDGQPLADLLLEGYDGWIWGMAVVDGSLLVLTPDDDPDVHEVYLRRFDPQTGAFEGFVVVDDTLTPYGLRCRPGEGR